MGKGDHLGELEHLVMLALLQLGDEAYGMSVRREIDERTDRDVAIGSVYATLERLEAKGFVRSRVSGPRAESGGRARKYFEITLEGGRALAQSRENLRRMTEGLAVDARLESL